MTLCFRHKYHGSHREKSGSSNRGCAKGMIIFIDSRNGKNSRSVWLIYRINRRLNVREYCFSKRQVEIIDTAARKLYFLA